ncbi:MAG: protein kinase [Treponema sp.]|nr:protein kinase [Treponema sp.]
MATIADLNRDKDEETKLPPEYVVHGWKISRPLSVDTSGEADVYIVQKDSQEAVLKYYKRGLKPKAKILETIKCLDAKGIVKVFDYGTDDERDGNWYEVMEYAQAGSLLSLVGEKLSSDEILDKDSGICRQLIEALKAFHDARIIHRDIKPENIFLRSKKPLDMCIGDFGISSVMEGDGENFMHKTIASARTPGYDATEILIKYITPKADYYALGIILWELATGKTLKKLMPEIVNEHVRATLDGKITETILKNAQGLDERVLYVIKGLLVREPAVRWGYEQVKKYLEGEHVEIWEHSFSIGGEDCTSFDDIVGSVKNKFPDCKEEIFDGTLGIFLGIHYPAVSKRVKAAVAKAKGMTDDDIAKSLICLALDPESLVLPNGFEAKSLDDVRRLTLQAPETMYKMYWNFNSALYEFLELKGAGGKIPAVKRMVDTHKDTPEEECLPLLREIAGILNGHAA